MSVSNPSAAIDVVVYSCIDSCLYRYEALTVFAFLNQGQTTLVILVNGHAIQTLKTLTVIDLALRFYGLVFTAMAAGLTRCTAGFAPRNPRPALQHIGGGQGCAQWANVSAIAAVDKHTQAQTKHQHEREIESRVTKRILHLLKYRNCKVHERT